VRVPWLLTLAMTGRVLAGVFLPRFSPSIWEAIALVALCVIAIMFGGIGYFAIADK
jgi:hypothetical protein